MSGTGKPKEYTVEDYLESLFEAIRNVGVRYIHENFHDEGVDFTHVERAFTYEVYHQWSTLINDKNVRIDAEISKQFVDENISKLFVNTENSERPYHRFYPDMVLHEGQGNSKNNFIVCEFKRMHNISNKLIIDDLKKLDLYVDQETKAGVSDWTPFHCGVFILIFHNTEGKCVQEELCNRLLSLSEDIRENIANQNKIICCISDGENFHHDFLCNLINED